VATGKSNRGLNEALVETGFGAYFLSTRTAEQTASKPSPMMLLQLLDEFGLQPAQAWVVGDTDFDLQMAHNAGCLPIAITHGAHSYERLMNASPAHVIDDLPSLLPLYHQAIRSDLNPRES
jgi:phosphoglycolate phosphatase